MGAVDLTKTLRKYKSGWVSISKNNKEVIASSRSLKSLLSKLEKLGNPDGYIMKAAKDYSSYVGVKMSYSNLKLS